MKITRHNWRVQKQPDRSGSQEAESDSGRERNQTFDKQGATHVTQHSEDLARVRITRHNWRRVKAVPHAASHDMPDAADVVTLGLDVNTSQPVTLSQDDRRQGLYIIGKNGTGKSTLIENLIVQDMEAGYGLCLLDPHGDLIDDVLKRIPAKRENDVILLDVADDTWAFGLNLFECTDPSSSREASKVAGHVVQVFKKVWEEKSWGPRLEDLLHNVALTLIENPPYTLAEVPKLLRDDRFRDQLTRQLQNEDVRDFWQYEYDPLRDSEQRDQRASTLNKVRAFLTPLIRDIIGQSTTTLDFRQIMDESKILLVKLAIGEAGEEAVGLIGSVLIGRILTAAMGRVSLPREQRVQFNLYADEYHRFATPDFAVLLAEARKYAIATTIAHQTRSQLDDVNRGASLGAGSLIVFEVTGEDADELAREFDYTTLPPEIVGERETRTISQNPFNHLVEHSHENTAIRRLTIDHLRPIYAITQSIDTPEVMRGEYQYAIEGANAHFVAMMEQRVHPNTAQEFESLLAIVRHLQTNLSTHRKRFYDGDTSHAYIDEQMEQAFLPYYHHLYNGDRAQADAVLAAALHEFERNPPEIGVDFISRTPLGRIRPEAEILAGWRKVGVLLTVLRDIGRLLVSEPILTGSGRPGPNYGSQRTYQDMQNEIMT